MLGDVSVVLLQTGGKDDEGVNGLILRTQLSSQGIELLEDRQPSRTSVLSLAQHVMKFDARQG